MKCYYCKRETIAISLLHGRINHPLALTRDHYIPLSRGGSRGVLNQRPACRQCNGLKGNMTPEQWGRWMALNPKWWLRYGLSAGSPVVPHQPTEENTSRAVFLRHEWARADLT